MLRTSRLLPALSLCLLANAAFAQAQPQQKPSDAPPKLEVIEEGADTPITVAPPKSAGPGAKITEKKEGGRVTEVKVKSGKSSYTMRPNIPAGNAQPGDAQSGAIRAPQWTVLEFDLGGKKKNTDKEAVPDAPARADAPPPPQPATK
jgi:hypothetical protein